MLRRLVFASLQHPFQLHNNHTSQLHVKACTPLLVGLLLTAIALPVGPKASCGTCCLRYGVPAALQDTKQQIMQQT
jgi:hypothetical protein